MRVQSIEISRGYSYSDESKPLTGKVKFTDAHGASLEVPLSPGAISRIIDACAKEVVSTIKEQVSAIPRALSTATDEGRLIEHDGNVSL